MDWKRQLGSRKFWALTAGVATSVLVLYGAGEDTAVKITGMITAVGSVVVYILAEAHVDATKKESDGDADSN
jgi:hypothetical protein